MLLINLFGMEREHCVKRVRMRTRITPNADTFYAVETLEESLQFLSMYGRTHLLR